MLEKKIRLCETCHRFLPREEKDRHPMCLICRPCSQATPCEFDMEWTAEEWDAFEEERAAKRTAERQQREQRREDKKLLKRLPPLQRPSLPPQLKKEASRSRASWRTTLESWTTRKIRTCRCRLNSR